MRRNRLEGHLETWSNEWAEAFRRNVTATELGGSWMVGQLANWVAPATKGLWRAAQLPESTWVSYGGTYYAIPRDSDPEKKALAWELIEMMTLDPARQLAALKTQDAFPALLAAQDDPMIDEPQPFLGGQRARELWREAARHITATAVHKQAKFAEDAVNAALDSVLDDGSAHQPGAVRRGAAARTARASLTMRLPAFLRLSPKWAPYVFISPFLILFGVFGVFPLCFSLYLAFQSWEPTGGLKAMEFVGLANFAFALKDAWFWTALKNTLWLAVASGVPQHLVALPLAAFIHTSFKRLRDGVIAVYFLPYITSTVAIAIMFNALFSQGLRDDQRGAGAAVRHARTSTGCTTSRTSSRRSRSSCSGATSASTRCCTWPRCRPSPASSTRPPRWTAPAAGGSSSTSRCPASSR